MVGGFNREEAMADKSQHIPLFEKIGYSAADAAANFVFMTMVVFQQAFYTDVMGLKPAEAALAILVPRLWDAFFDPIMGGLADRTRTRWGRFRPWILWTAIPWGVVMFLAYMTPGGVSHPVLLTWAVVTNMLLMTLYSANNMPYSALGGVMSSDIQERSQLNSYRFMAVNAAQFIVVGFTPVLVNRFAGPHPPDMAADVWARNRAFGWEVTMAIYAVICVVCFFITFFTTQERVKPVTVEKTPLSRDLGDLLKNGPWAVMFAMTLFHFALLSFRGGSEYQYYIRYADPKTCYDVLNRLGLTAPALAPGESPHGLFGQLGYIVYGGRGDPNSTAPSAIFGLFGMVGKVFTIASIMFAPMLAKRFGKKAVCIAGFALMIVNSVGFYFLGPTNVMGMLLLTITGSTFYGPTIPLIWAIYADVVDYGELKFSRRATGMVFATIGFGLKAGLALGGAALGWVEDAVGYDPNNVSAAMVQAFRVCTTLVPAGLFAICTILLIAYKLNKQKTLQMVQELDERRNVLAA
jgi:Na+/melibiose symporter-like transporter